MPNNKTSTTCTCTHSGIAMTGSILSKPLSKPLLAVGLEVLVTISPYAD
jgi:hypothetical protein